MKDIRFNQLDKSSCTAIAELLNELAPSFSIELLVERLEEMFERNYQCVGIYYNQELVGVCGVWVLTKYYSGRHIEPDNVFIKPEYQNQGIGKKLNEWLVAFAHDNGCKAIELNCYNENHKGQAFWEENGFEAIGIHYSKSL